MRIINDVAVIQMLLDKRSHHFRRVLENNLAIYKNATHFHHSETILEKNLVAISNGAESDRNAQSNLINVTKYEQQDDQFHTKLEFMSVEERS